MAAYPDPSLRAMSDHDLGRLIVRAIDDLSSRGTHESFSELLGVVAHAGERVGDAARGLAANRSWSEVAELSGTSKQAAWSRWRAQDGAD